MERVDLWRRLWNELPRERKVAIKAATGWEVNRDGLWVRESVDLNEDGIRAMIAKYKEHKKWEHDKFGDCKGQYGKMRKQMRFGMAICY